MKSRVFTYISLLALVVALAAAATASAQSASPAQSVYNPNGEVLDVVQGGGKDDVANDTVPEENVCSAADGVDANGNATTFGSSADCSTTRTVCAAADGRDAGGNSVAYGSSADCSTATPAVSTNQLPFTGFESGLVALAGIALLGAGFAMRRVARRPTA